MSNLSHVATHLGQNNSKKRKVDTSIGNGLRELAESQIICAKITSTTQSQMAIKDLNIFAPQLNTKERIFVSKHFMNHVDEAAMFNFMDTQMKVDAIEEILITFGN